MIDNSLPIGSIVPYGGETISSEIWKLCNGSMLSKTEYPELFAKIGYRFGGSENLFALPNQSEASFIGYDSTGSVAKTLGSSVGSNTHHLTESELPITQSEPNAWTIQVSADADSGVYAIPGSDNNTGNADYYSNITAEDRRNLPIGGGEDFSIVSKSIVVNYIIKVKSIGGELPTVNFNGTSNQIENTTNKATSISSSSTDTQYPSAKAVYDYIDSKEASVDQTYSATSENAQSGRAVAEAISNFENCIDTPENIFEYSQNYIVDQSGGATVLNVNNGIFISSNNVNYYVRFPISCVVNKTYKISLNSDVQINSVSVATSKASADIVKTLSYDNGTYYGEFTSTQATMYLKINLKYNMPSCDITNVVCYDKNDIYINNECLKNIPESSIAPNVIPRKTSDLINDSSFSTIPTRHNKNLWNDTTYSEDNLDGVRIGYIVNKNTGNIYAQDGYKTVTVDIEGKGTGIFGMQLVTSSSNSLIYRDIIFRYAFMNSNNTYISGGENANADSTTPTIITIPSNAKYFICSAYNSSDNYNNPRKYLTTTEMSQSKWGYYYFIPYRNKVININDLDWYGKTILTYGDSITAIGNGDSNSAGWQGYVCDYFGITTHHGRGIGSSTITNRDATWFANSDGSYNSRPPQAQPDGTTVHQSSYCLWDRISTMITDDIKDSIDLVFIMGGTNDFIASQPIGNEPVWSSENTTDTLWALASEYNGGDFDINTFKGGLASTIMKIQARCPKSKVIVGTLLNGYGTSENQSVNDISLKPESYSIATKEVCESMGVPCVDVFGTCGINTLNRDGKITDGTHPYSIDGCKLLASAVISGIKNTTQIIE